jgi:CHAT domain-containing protein
LNNVQLVVLSACETGLGEVRDQEGVYGLQRAFRLAGARNIVMSLWRVPDAPTRAFMEAFYASLMEKGEARTAFAAARQAMRRQYGNPYYWAGFVLLE